jgi:hypothetical protein
MHGTDLLSLGFAFRFNYFIVVWITRMGAEHRAVASGTDLLSLGFALPFNYFIIVWIIQWTGIKEVHGKEVTEMWEKNKKFFIMIWKNWEDLMMAKKSEILR